MITTTWLFQIVLLVLYMGLGAVAYHGVCNWVRSWPRWDAGGGQLALPEDTPPPVAAGASGRLGDPYVAEILALMTLQQTQRLACELDDHQVEILIQQIITERDQ